MNARDRLLGLLVPLMWGLNFLALDIGLQHFPPVFLTGLRYAVLVLPTVLFVPWPRVRLRWFLGYGLGLGTLQFAFLSLALDNGMPPGLASLVLQASAPFTVVLGVLLLREHLTPVRACGVALAVLGMLAIAWNRSQHATALPVLLTLLGALSWTFGNLCARKAEPANGLHLALWISTVPPLPMFALSAVLEGPTAGWSALATSTDDAQGWIALGGLAYTALGSTVVGSGVWTTLMQRHPAGLVAPFALLVPVVGMTAAWLALGERPHVVELAAGAVILAGVFISSNGPTARAQSAQAQPAQGRSAEAQSTPGTASRSKSGFQT